MLHGCDTRQRATSKVMSQRMDQLNLNLCRSIANSKCLLCSKLTVYLSTHYANYHDTHEVYNARMPSKTAKPLRRNAAEASTRSDGKINAHCHYCGSDFNLERHRWIGHLVRYTGDTRGIVTNAVALLQAHRIEVNAHIQSRITIQSLRLPIHYTSTCVIIAHKVKRKI